MSYTIETYKLKGKHRPVIAAGIAIGNKISKGKARVITNKKDIHKFKKGEVLITNFTTPDWEPLLKKAAALVSDKGNRTAHSAIVARELGVPAVVGAKIATQAIKTGQNVTVDCTLGDVGRVYKGNVAYTKRIIKLNKLPKTKCSIMLNTSSPIQAKRHAKLPADGVGLVRLEFIINEQIKIHPLAILQPKKIKNPKTRNKIKIILAKVKYSNPKQYYHDQILHNITRIAEAFYPRKVFIRLADLKSDEYRHLIGGDELEPHESNPMLGWRGATRFYDKKYRQVFALECKAIAQARNKFTNIQILVPYIRSRQEAQLTLALLAKYGLKSGRKKLIINMMLETPANILAMDEYVSLFDGFSLGTNDLTQLTLGVDRGNAQVSHLFNEQGNAVKSLINTAIKTAHKHRKTIGICGQAPSDFPDFAKYLVEHKIDYISLNPDELLTTRLHIAKIK